MTRIAVDVNNVIGKIKPMHAVGQPPFTGGFASIDFSPMQILKDANIPYSRLHDVGGVFAVQLLFLPHIIYFDAFQFRICQ